MKDWKYAFVRTLPVLCGYLFLGFAYGVLMRKAGYGPGWSLASSLFVFAGSMQFLMVELLQTGASLLLCAAMTALLNSRHLFYGLSFIEKFRSFGAARHYLIFSLSDETYSVFCSLPAERQTRSVMVKIAVLDQFYWTLGGLLGGLLGAVLPFDAAGIDFAMTALFIVILMEQILSAKSRLPIIIGLASSLVFLLTLGKDVFILPALVVTVAVLLGARKPITRKLEEVDV